MVVYLVQQEGAVTGHPSSVVHRCRDVAAREVNAGLMNNIGEMQTALPSGLFLAGGTLTRHWPLARRSQRTPSGRTCCGRDQTAGGSWPSASWQVLYGEERRRSRQCVKAEASGPTAEGTALDSHTGRGSRLSGQEVSGGKMNGQTNKKKHSMPDSLWMFICCWVTWRPDGRNTSVKSSQEMWGCAR